MLQRPSALLLPTDRAQVSIEPGHFYAETFNAGPEALADRFRLTKCFADVALQGMVGSISFMYDEYHEASATQRTPAQTLTRICDTAKQVGLPLDYLAREGACTLLAEQALSLLDTTNLVRTTATGSGWLVDERPESAPQAMGSLPTALTPNSTALYRDIELYDTSSQGAREWSCPFLASIWHCLRLGALTHPAFDEPALITGKLPAWEHWEQVPPLIQVNPAAPPFTAGISFSTLPAEFLPVETSVQQILGQLSPILQASPALPSRLNHVFIAGM